MKKILIIFSLLTISGFSQTPYDFLRMDFSARSAALGGSFVTNVDDPNVIFYNPAGVCFTENNTISFGYIKHLLDVNSGSISLAPELPKIGKVGIGIQFVNYGSFDQKDEFGNILGTFSSNQLAATFNYSRMINSTLAYGGNFKLIYSNIGEYNSSAIALDLGITYYDSSNRFGIGFSMLNIGTQLKSYVNTREDLPFEIRAGITKKLEHLPARFTFDFLKLNNTQDGFFSGLKNFAVGIELLLSKSFNARIGYNNQRKQDLKLGTSSGLLGYNAGIGIIIDKYRLDYGISLLGKIGEMHRINFYLNY